MPLYRFVCSECEHDFEKIVSYETSCSPIECPECKKDAANRMPSAPLFGDADRMFAQKKTSSGWKSVLKKIHDGSPGSRMTETSSIDFGSKE